MPSVTSIAAASEPTTSDVAPASLLLSSSSSSSSAPDSNPPGNQGTRPTSPHPPSPSADSKPEPAPGPVPVPATIVATSTTSTTTNIDLEEEEELKTRLRHRRLELDHEIEEFKIRKDAEYRRFEAALRAEAKAKRREKEAATAAAANTSLTGSNKPGELVVPISSLSPLGSNNNNNNNLIRQSLALASTSPGTPPEVRLLRQKSPPFEKELQVAGLFAPSYLPLLEDRRGGEYDPLSSTPTTTTTSTSTAMATDVPGAKPPSRNSSPTAPPASSLKSSSYFDSHGRSERKPKSPKKVTFQFEDESTVPSRSSPPPTKVTWNFGVVDDADDVDYEEVEEVDYTERPHDAVMEHLRAQMMGLEDRPTVQHVEDRTIPASMFRSIGSNSLGDFSRYHGDELVTPTLTGLGLGADHYNGMGTSTNDAMPSRRNDLTTGSWTSQLTPSNLNGTMKMSDNDDDDDEGLFDLDETVPDALPQTPPHRDLSPLIEAQLAAQQIAPEAGEINLAASLRASYASRAAPPSSKYSFSKEPFSFGKSPVPAPAMTHSRFTSPFSSSFTQNPMRTNGSAAGTMAPHARIASSLPATTTWGFAANKDSGHFRRRSINKYIPSPPPEEESERATPEPEVLLARSPFGTSVPMAITPRLSSLRSPPASTSPRNQPAADIPEEEPPSGGEPLTFYVDYSAEALAASPPKPRGSSELDSYMKTARFPSANMTSNIMSPYRTRFAQELAQQALMDGEDPNESFVGGVDGRTGLDPESFSVRGRASSFASPSANLKNAAWSLSARLAVEDEMDASRRM
ncbi:hypothetical protein BZA05DRAFT_403781 [Tricharina praecox]|uniref:uncharacterized protein n=1 Tax=Tricharina praecox TaxID=43433 RepID=UPI002220AE64|nr:uncharacterized protein BZA05DRAFT_403781 [Tricharina praecox]KAI5848344.1 hypothetical protein BZA05DRAFT_403781 [Tricharina praecox]